MQKGQKKKKGNTKADVKLTNKRDGEKRRKTITEKGMDQRLKP